MREDPSRGDAARRTPGLTDFQHEAFWTTIVVNYRDAMMAAHAQHVRAQDVRDVVHTTAVKLIEQYERRPKTLPETEEHRRAVLLKAVGRYAIDCVLRGQRVDAPVHRHWGEPILLPPGGRRAPDRACHKNFTRVTTQLASVVAAAEEEGELDTLDSLIGIMQEARSRLPLAEMLDVDVYFLLDNTRAEAARIRRVKPDKFNNRMRCAYANLRRILREMIASGDIPERSRWKEVIETSASRYEARMRRRTERLRRSRGKRSGSGPESPDPNPPT